MRLALRAKKKLGFIDGLISEPEDDDAKEKNGGLLAPQKKKHKFINRKRNCRSLILNTTEPPTERRMS